MEANQEDFQINFEPSSEESGKRKVAMSILPSIRQTKIQIPTSQNQEDFQINFEPSSEESGKRKVAMSLLPSLRQTKVQILTEPQANEIQNNTTQQQNSPENEEKNPKEPLNQDIAKTPTLMTVDTLSMLPYSEYSKAEYS